MIRFITVCSLFFVAINCRADDPGMVGGAKKLAQEMVDATINGSYAKVIDHTLDTVVKEMGGREKAIAAVESIMSNMKNQGMSIKSFKLGEVGKLHTEGNNTFIVIHSNMEMTFSGGKILSKSYLLGISPDKGKNWKFADGSGIGNKALREKLLPKLPEGLKLPETEQPKIIKD